MKSVHTLPPTHTAPADIREISVNPNLSREERIAEFLRQIGDPCCFKCGKFTVHAQYAKDGPSLEECLKQILI